MMIIMYGQLPDDGNSDATTSTPYHLDRRASFPAFQPIYASSGKKWEMNIGSQSDKDRGFFMDWLLSFYSSDNTTNRLTELTVLTVLI